MQSDLTCSNFTTRSVADYIKLQDSIQNTDELVAFVYARIISPQSLDMKERFKFAKIVVFGELRPDLRLFAYMLFAGIKDTAKVIKDDKP